MPTPLTLPLFFRTGSLGPRTRGEWCELAESEITEASRAAIPQRQRLQKTGHFLIKREGAETTFLSSSRKKHAHQRWGDSTKNANVRITLRLFVRLAAAVHWAANRPVICRKSLTRAGDLPFVRRHTCHGGFREKKTCRTRELASSLGWKCSVSEWCGARGQDYESAVTQAAKGACDGGSRAKARNGSAAYVAPGVAIPDTHNVGNCGKQLDCRGVRARRTKASQCAYRKRF